MIPFRLDGRPSRWTVTDRLCDGWPWAWGATHTEPAPKDWVCADCQQHSDRRHVYPDTARCVICAQVWCQTTYTTTAIYTVCVPAPKPAAGATQLALKIEAAA